MLVAVVGVAIIVTRLEQAVLAAAVMAQIVPLLVEMELQI
jgi:hypothetical protein